MYGQAHRTALFHCARRGDAAAVSLLLQVGSDADRRDVHGQTALMKAAMNDHAHCVRLLLSAGASPALRDDSSDSALLAAAQHDAGDAVRALCEHPTNRAALDERGGEPDLHPPLVRAATFGCARAACALLEQRTRGMDVEARDGTGATALIAACKHGNLRLAQLLLAHSASPAVRDNDGDSALTWAAWAGHTEVVEWLLGCTPLRSAVDAVDDMDDTALCKAARMGHLACARLLLDKGKARVDERSIDGAVRMGHDDCVLLLMDRRDAHPP